jgi:DNA invertase Pin-like site-specific DNA recombinase
MKEKRAMRVAIYARVSTNNGGQDPLNQLMQLRQHCADEGWVIVEEFVDHASGGRSDRERFQAMLKAALRKPRQFDLVLFWSLDRFSREGVLKTLQHLERITGAGLEYQSLQEQYLNTLGDFRDAVISILAAVAKIEKRRISERTKAGLDKLKAQGQMLGRAKARDDVALVQSVREMRAEGKSVREIAGETGKSTTTIMKLLHLKDSAAA